MVRCLFLCVKIEFFWFDTEIVQSLEEIWSDDACSIREIGVFVGASE